MDTIGWTLNGGPYRVDTSGKVPYMALFPSEKVPGATWYFYLHLYTELPLGVLWKILDWRRMMMMRMRMMKRYEGSSAVQFEAGFFPFSHSIVH